MGATHSKEKIPIKKIDRSTQFNSNKMCMESAFRCCFLGVKNTHNGSSLDYCKSISGIVTKNELARFFECYAYASGVPGSANIKKLYQYYSQFAEFFGNRYSIEINNQYYHEDGCSVSIRCELSFVDITLADVMCLLEVFSSWPNYELQPEGNCITYKGICTPINKFYSQWKDFFHEQLNIGFKMIALLGAAKKHTPYEAIWLDSIRPVFFIPDVAEEIASFLPNYIKLSFFENMAKRAKSKVAEEKTKKLTQNNQHFSANVGCQT